MKRPSAPFIPLVSRPLIEAPAALTTVDSLRVAGASTGVRCWGRWRELCCFSFPLSLRKISMPSRVFNLRLYHQGPLFGAVNKTHACLRRMKHHQG